MSEPSTTPRINAPAISALELFSVGLGPSSSHTVGPMRAAFEFTERLEAQGCLGDIAKIDVELYGSLALTGKGHHTDTAVCLGLSGGRVETITPPEAEICLKDIEETGHLKLAGTVPVLFSIQDNIHFNKDTFLPEHPNGMTVFAFGADNKILLEATYFSTGGGFITCKGETETQGRNVSVPIPFTSGEELLKACSAHNLSIAEIMLKNESAWRNEAETTAELLRIREVMMDCIERSCDRSGNLPGGLKVRRRARDLMLRLQSQSPIPSGGASDGGLPALDWVSLYALAVNEENACGGQVVTAPTNGAAGVLPAVLKYYETFCLTEQTQHLREKKSVEFLLTCAAIGSLYKLRASISAAEVGCQGEIGVACSMAAGGLAAVLGGTPMQVENAAEIGMEHNLGLTCDPIGGLVQIPCIERNSMGAIKAITAARLALSSDGQHIVSLDEVIETMRQTGADMNGRYKETSLGGLATVSVNHVAC